MKSNFFVLALILVSGGLIFTSCSSSDDSLPEEDSGWLIGQWEITAYAEYYDIEFVELEEGVMDWSIEFMEDGTFEYITDEPYREYYDKLTGTYTYDAQEESIRLLYGDDNSDLIQIEGKTENSAEVTFMAEYEGETLVSQLQKWERN